MRRIVPAIFLSCAIFASASAQQKDMFIIRDTAKSQKEVAADIKSYVEENKWLFMAEFGLLGGKVTALKICYPDIAPDIVAAGMHVMAMMPCGHLAVYQEQGKTRVSMLHPRFMTVLQPDENLEKAVERVTPLFQKMLDEVL